MNGSITVSSRLLAAGAVAAMVAGGAAALAWREWRQAPAPPHDVAANAAPAPAPAGAAGGHVHGAGDRAVTLSHDAMTRAGLVVAPVERGTVRGAIGVPGIIEPDAYDQVVVTPLVAGRVARVAAELGQRVRRGQVLATIASPEMSEARARVRAARAELDAHDRALRRTEKLAAIGAASRQELEQAHAEHTAQVAAVDAARARVSLLLGGATDDEAADAPSEVIAVRAPIDGTVVARAANAGLNVDPAAALFTIADLSTVWAIADVYEQDLARVAVGMPATVTVPSLPDLRLDGRVAYIDPQIAAATRTARIRVELPNPGQRLRLGMYVSVSLDTSGTGTTAATADGLSIPRGAVQLVADRAVVYVVDPNDRHRFVERQVQLGAASGDRVAVLSGLAAGETIVVEGSFVLRAEMDRN
jgi:cobalt-zinc-cadmium efflux system membrane fusion protein